MRTTTCVAVACGLLCLSWFPPRVVAQVDGGDQQPAAAAERQTTVQLLDAGAEPRSMLRYQLRPDRTDQMIMDMQIAMAMQMGDFKQPEMQMPTTRSTMRIDSKQRSAEGDLRYEFEMTKVEVLPGENVNPVVLNAMKQQMSSMQGMSGSATISSRGFTREANIKLPEGVSPQVKQMMQTMKQSLNQMSAPLPAEPVGKGARWQVTIPMQSPVKLTQTATYTLKEIQGDTLTCDVAIEQSANEQQMNVPAAPGVTVLLNSLRSSGTGTMELDLTSVVPKSQMELATTSVVSANNQKIQTTVRTQMKIHP